MSIHKKGWEELTMSHSAKRRKALAELQDNMQMDMCLGNEAQKTWNVKRKFL